MLFGRGWSVELREAVLKARGLTFDTMRAGYGDCLRYDTLDECVFVLEECTASYKDFGEFSRLMCTVVDGFSEGWP